MASPQYITHFTRSNERVDPGDDALSTLFLSVYNDLEAVARSMMKSERVGHTLGTHGLLNETYCRLIASYQDRHKVNEFDVHDLQAVTAVIMRRVLVDHARARKHRITNINEYALHLESSSKMISEIIVDLITLDESLIELEAIDPQKARIVELRFFGALPMQKIALMMNQPLRTVERDWSFARAWLCARHSDSGQSNANSSRDVS